jgi:hypothetical protein
MDSQHSTVQKGAVLLSYCLILVLRIYILKYLLRSERFTTYTVTFKPQSRSEIILIVRNVNVVFSEILFFLVQIIIPTDLYKPPLVAAFVYCYLLIC